METPKTGQETRMPETLSSHNTRISHPGKYNIERQKSKKTQKYKNATNTKTKTEIPGTKYKNTKNKNTKTQKRKTHTYKNTKTQK